MNYKNRLNFIKQYFQNAIRYSVLIFITVLFNFQFASAQVKFIASAPCTIPLNQNFKIKFSLENSLFNEFAFLSNDEFEIIGSPIIETNTQIINGVTTQKETRIYLLHPIKQGVFTIPGATCFVNGIQLKSNSVVVTVTKSTLKKSKQRKDYDIRKKEQKEINNPFKIDVKRV